MENNQADEIYRVKDAKRGVDYIGVACVFFCHDGQGNLLLHKRSANCRDEHGRWDCGGGAMEFGEDFEIAVAREIREEYGVDPLEIKRAAVANVIRDNQGVKTHWIAVVHAAKVDPSGVRIGEPDKMDEIGWFKIDQLPDPLHSMLMRHFESVKEHIIRPE